MPTNPPATTPEGARPHPAGRHAPTRTTPLDRADPLQLLTQRCTDLFDVSAAGAMVADDAGRLRTVAMTTEASNFTELFDLQSSDGPCIDSYTFRQPVVEPELAAHSTRWPSFATRAYEAGIRSAAAVPLQFNGTTIGSLGLLTTEPGALDERETEIGQALACFATLSLHQQRRIHQARERIQQLQTALDSRIIIEQAKGMLAQHCGVTPDEAFHALRGYARSNRLRLSQDVCQGVVDGTQDLAGIAAFVGPSVVVPEGNPASTTTTTPPTRGHAGA